MRWEALFRDLEARADEAARAELADEVADRSRREVARLRLTDRLRAGIGRPVRLGVDGAGQVAGVLTRCGPDWLVLAVAEGRRAEVLVSLDALLWVAGLSDDASDPESMSAVDQRWTLGYVVRGLARDRAGVQIGLRDGGRLAGTVDRVGADFIDVAEHPLGEPRREREVAQSRIVALAAIATITIV